MSRYTNSNNLIVIESLSVSVICMESKSLYRSRAGRHFYGTENVIWAGFGPIGNTEKKSLGRL